MSLLLELVSISTADRLVLWSQDLILAGVKTRNGYV